VLRQSHLCLCRSKLVPLPLGLSITDFDYIQTTMSAFIDSDSTNYNPSTFNLYCHQINNPLKLKLSCFYQLAFNASEFDRKLRTNSRFIHALQTALLEINLSYAGTDGQIFKCEERKQAPISRRQSVAIPSSGVRGINASEAAHGSRAAYKSSDTATAGGDGGGSGGGFHAGECEFGRAPTAFSATTATTQGPPPPESALRELASDGWRRQDARSTPGDRTAGHGDSAVSVSDTSEENRERQQRKQRDLEKRQRRDIHDIVDRRRSLSADSHEDGSFDAATDSHRGQRGGGIEENSTVGRCKLHSISSHRAARKCLVQTQLKYRGMLNHLNCTSVIVAFYIRCLRRTLLHDGTAV